jgi:Outer membrane protein beta-barrel domain
MGRRALGIALVCLSCWPLTVAAERCEEAPRARAAVLGAATFNSGDTAATIAGSFGYRVDRCFGLELEIGIVPDLQDDPQVIPLSSVFGPAGGVLDGTPVPTIFPPPTFDNRLITFMMNARVAVPTTLRTIVPYVVGGGGIASLRRDVTYRPFVVPEQGQPGNTVPITLLPRSSSSTETALALTVGAGVSIRIFKELFADADMRYVRVFANDELDLNRFGAGISYRF